MDSLEHHSSVRQAHHPEFSRLQLLVLQSTPFCNINCDYCYLPNRSLRRSLSLDLLKRIFEVLFASEFVGDDFTVVWHAGEPLVMPIKYYRAAIQRIDELNTTRRSISHAFQTNGMLITQAWCDFFKRYQINVGVSLDGPAFIHDTHRKTRSGQGTHAQVMRGVSLLQRNKIKFHVIAVLSQKSLNFADEIFDFFLQHEIYQVGFNIEEKEGVNTSSSLEQDGTALRYKAFMNRMYDLVRNSPGLVNIREFENVIHSMSYDHLTAHSQQTIPFAILSIDCDGNLSTFSPELLGLESSAYGDFILGNIWQDTLESICSTDKFLRMYQDIMQGVELCKNTCGYYDLCGGGAPANKYFENGTFDSTETMYCRYTIQTPIDILLEDLEKSLYIRGKAKVIR